MTIPKDIIEKNIGTLFGYEEMTDEEKAELLTSVGEAIFESAVLRYLADRSDEEMVAFERFLDEHEEDEHAFEKVIEQFPDFAILLTEEAHAMREEAARVLKSDLAE